MWKKLILDKHEIWLLGNLLLTRHIIENLHFDGNMIYMEKLILDKHEIWLLDFNNSILTSLF